MISSDAVGSHNASELVQELHMDSETLMTSGNQNEAGSTLVSFNQGASNDP